MVSWVDHEFSRWARLCPAGRCHVRSGKVHDRRFAALAYYDAVYRRYILMCNPKRFVLAETPGESPSGRLFIFLHGHVVGVVAAESFQRFSAADLSNQVLYCRLKVSAFIGFPWRDWLHELSWLCLSQRASTHLFVPALSLRFDDGAGRYSIVEAKEISLNAPCQITRAG
jgi:hypothetical protein